MLVSLIFPSQFTLFYYGMESALTCVHKVCKSIQFECNDHSLVVVVQHC